MSIIDPVCGMEVFDPDPLLEVEHEGAKYFFCAPSCRDRFVRDPDRYVSERSPAKKRDEPGGIG